MELDQIRAALAEGVSPSVVLADARYGDDTAFRTGLSDLGLTYVVGIQPNTSLWKPGEAPLPPKPWSGCPRPPSRVRRDPEHKPNILTYRITRDHDRLKERIAHKSLKIVFPPAKLSK